LTNYTACSLPAQLFERWHISSL